MDKEEIRHKIDSYKWYHRIRVHDDIFTSPAPEINGGRGYLDVWNFILQEMQKIDFTDKKVLDIGCRDGFFSFEAERRGAKEIVGIDNDISLGTKEFLIPYFNSKVMLHKLNLYDLTPELFGSFDIILFFGVLYHLRYPFRGLKTIINCLEDEGLLLVESGMLVEESLQEHAMLYCPVEESPYEMSSCTFFNKQGLSTTLRTFGCGLVDFRTLQNSTKSGPAKMMKSLRNLIFGLRSPQVTRQFMIFQKNSSLIREYSWLFDYWDTTHLMHSH